jgi:hypothetical protein
MQIYKKEPLILIFNLKEKIEHLYSVLVENSLKQRYKIDTKISYNFPVDKDKNFNFVYSCFLENVKSNLKCLTLLEKNTNQCWVYVTNKDYYETIWHNHINSSTINGVLYLKLLKDEKGILFNHKNETFKIIPKQYDLIVFPNWLEHCPIPNQNGDDTRISINMEILCEENLSIENLKNK